jgi:hypothetical protein
MAAPPVAYAGASLLLPEGYTLTASDASGLTAASPAGDLLQLRAQPTNLPRPMRALLRRNRDQFLQLLSAQAPALLQQTIAAQAESASVEGIQTQIIALPAGSALFASAQLTVRGVARTLALWLLAPPDLERFYVLSLSTVVAQDTAQVQTLMTPVLASLRLSG